MTDVIPVSVEWLTLREPADARARSRALAEKAVRLAHAPYVVHDLGSGTGSMVRWLAPLLHGKQTWVLHDWNPALLAHATGDFAPDGDRRDHDVHTRVNDVALLEDGDLVGASLVTTSALLDVLTHDEAAAIVRACIAAAAPALFTLTVTGEVRLSPDDPGDRVFETAFNDHQRRTTDGRRLLGPDAVATVIGMFRAAGWAVKLADSPWRLDASEPALVAEWLDGWIAAAVEERPALREWADEYLRTRMTQLGDGRLQVVVHHGDLLAWPP